MRYIVFFFLFLYSCNSSDTKLSPKVQFDNLENIFSSDNWKITGNTDTSYMYFSRQGDMKYTVYDFKLAEGDSSINEVSYINYIKNTVTWIRSADTLKLVSIDSSTAKWNSLKDNKPFYNFNKLSENSISIELPEGMQLLMTKTLSLATFLVRSRYDYLHNTHTVDSPIVRPRGESL